MDWKYIEDDMKLWMLLNEGNYIIYSNGSDYISIEITSETMDTGVFEMVKKVFNQSIRIDYCDKWNGVMRIIVNLEKNKVRIEFNRIITFSHHLIKYLPWIEIHEKSIIYHHHYTFSSCDNICEKMLNVSNIHELYTKMKDITVSIAETISVKNKIATYYESLPLFETILYYLKKMHKIPKEEIIIEI